MVSMQDIATKAGVSVGTVSRALNYDETGVSQDKAEKIRVIAEQMGYRKKVRQPKPTKQTHKRQSKVLILLSHSVSSEMTNPYSTKIRLSIENKLAKNNYAYDILRLQQVNHDIIHFIRGYEAILVVGFVSDTVGDTLHQVTDNVIFIDSEPLKKYDCIMPDIEKGIEEYLDLFITNNIAKIGLITGKRAYIDEHNKMYKTEDLRLTTFKKVLRQYGLYNSHYIVENGNVGGNDQFETFGGYTIEGGYHAMKTLMLTNDLPEVIIAGCDVIAIGMVEALLEAGIQPGEDIGIVSFDNIDLAKYYKVPITTMDLSMEDLGEVAVENMMSRFNGRKLSVHTKIPLNLVVRETWQPNLN